MMSVSSVDVFDTGESFKSIEIGYMSAQDRIYFDNIHLTLWQSDAASDGSRAKDWGHRFLPHGFSKTSGCRFFVRASRKGLLRFTNHLFPPGWGIFRAKPTSRGSV